MDFSFALRFFALMLTLICILLIPLAIRREPAPHPIVVSLVALPRSKWPGRLASVGVACLLASFALLAAATCVLLPR
ncbi:MAG TPA: hypothetical protein VNE00_05880 [Paraburkholderia sp.]|jgi:hypothetical protein|nr:hypothetical protein [Paraburkholderia sp.]